MTGVDVDALQAALEAEVDERVANGRCGCGCNAGLTGSKRRRYVNERHRQRAYRHRLERVATALGVPARLSRQTLQTADTTHKRHADAQNAATAPQRRRPRPPRPGISVYFRDVRTLERLEVSLALAVDVGTIAGEDVVDAMTAIALALDRRRRRSRA